VAPRATSPTRRSPTERSTSAAGTFGSLCRVDRIGELGETKQASLFFNLWGGRLGEVPIFASISGYAPSAEAAIVEGGCLWACSFAPVLLAALANTPSEQVTVLDVEVDGRPFRMFLDKLDRSMAFSTDAPSIEDAIREGRKRLAPEGWLVSHVLGSGTLPVLPRDEATVISAFVMDMSGSRTFEVKVNGADWPACTNLLDDVPEGPPGVASLLRELAVLVPREATDSRPAVPLERAELDETLAPLRKHVDSRALTRWRGFAAHGGQFADPIPADRLEALEVAAGRLPEDYRAFVTGVAGSGAGPGYGLLSPLQPAQLELARGEFGWRNGDVPETPPRGVIALAHGGCGVMWLLVVSGPRRGEVWADAVGSDERARRVAPSFASWYRAWLDALVRDAPDFLHWDPTCCSSYNAFSQVFAELSEQGMNEDAAAEHLAAEGNGVRISILSGGSSYFEAQSRLDPCQGCCALAERIGLPSTVYPDGVEPFAGMERPHEGEEPKRRAEPGLLGRFRRLFGGH
jgi:hypothetical protein